MCIRDRRERERERERTHTLNKSGDLSTIYTPLHKKLLEMSTRPFSHKTLGTCKQEPSALLTLETCRTEIHKKATSGLGRAAKDNGICALEKAHMRSIQVLRRFPNIVLKTVLMFQQSQRRRKFELNCPDKSLVAYLLSAAALEQRL